MGRSKHFKKNNAQRKGRVFSMERLLDAQTLRDTVGMTLYDRIMQWNDSGAAEALQVAEQRRKATEIKKPCWVPKLKNDMYIGSVDWGMKESEEVCNMPKSAVAFAKELSGELCDWNKLSPPRECTESKENFSIVGSKRMRENLEPDMWDNGVVLNTSILDAPFMVDSVLEHCPDGPRLLVGGWPVEPSGWDDRDSELPDAPRLVEAVLEDFEDGQRLLVGGWPVQPSWDEIGLNLDGMRTSPNTATRIMWTTSWGDTHNAFPDNDQACRIPLGA